MRNGPGEGPRTWTPGPSPADRKSVSVVQASRLGGVRRRGEPGPPTVEPMTPAPDADVCAHHRCHDGEDLGRVRRAGGGVVVVCWRHALELLDAGGEWA